jgi:hypothetical protein
MYLLGTVERNILTKILSESYYKVIFLSKEENEDRAYFSNLYIPYG